MFKIIWPIVIVVLTLVVLNAYAAPEVKVAFSVKGEFPKVLQEVTTCVTTAFNDSKVQVVPFNDADIAVSLIHFTDEHEVASLALSVRGGPLGHVVTSFNSPGEEKLSQFLCDYTMLQSQELIKALLESKEENTLDEWPQDTGLDTGNKK